MFTARGGRMTVSMTWITPSVHSTSVLMTSAPVGHDRAILEFD
jgi:hypothetical protein